MPRARAVALVVAVSIALIGALVFASSRGGRPGVAAPETVPVADADTSVPAPSNGTGSTSATTPSIPTTSTPPSPTDVAAHPLPAGSGAGRRMVFSLSSQRIWWVESNGSVIRTGLGSGRPESPVPGTYSVYSRSEHATGLDGSRMERFVRFTKGPNGWAIGFHSIPTVGGAPVQSEAELGQALSHGCIRQGAADADFTWQFAPVGSIVVVLA